MFFLLLALWLLLNGRVTTEVVIIGSILSAVIYWASYKLLGVGVKWEISLFRRSLKAIMYLFLLVWNVLVSNVQVMGVILSPKANKLTPRLVWFKSPVKTTLGQVILANSITLTPGTITAGLYKDQYCIHALDESFAGGMDESDFVKAIKKMEE